MTNYKIIVSNQENPELNGVYLPVRKDNISIFPLDEGKTSMIISIPIENGNEGEYNTFECIVPMITYQNKQTGNYIYIECDYRGKEFYCYIRDNNR